MSVAARREALHRFAACVACLRAVCVTIVSVHRRYATSRQHLANLAGPRVLDARLSCAPRGTCVHSSTARISRSGPSRSTPWRPRLLFSTSHWRLQSRVASAPMRIVGAVVPASSPCRSGWANRGRVTDRPPLGICWYGLVDCARLRLPHLCPSAGVRFRAPAPAARRLDIQATRSQVRACPRHRLVRGWQSRSTVAMHFAFSARSRADR